MSELSILFDKYARVARLYPTVLFLAPWIWTVALLAPDRFNSWYGGTATTIAILAILYFTTGLVRNAGVGAEKKLIARWGGWYTTILLRRSDTMIDPLTKSRYHASLAALCPDIAWPNADAEAMDQTAADTAFHSATRRLIGLRRKSDYNLLLDENISYGFRRNMYGIRVVASFAAIAAALLAFGSLWIHAGMPSSESMIGGTIASSPAMSFFIAVDLIIAILWPLLVTEEFVRRAAIAYAVALLRTLDGDGAR